MRRFRRRRFRRGRGNVVRQRPTWRKLFDTVDGSFGRGPFDLINFPAGGSASFPALALGQPAATNFYTLGGFQGVGPGAGAGPLVVVGESTVDFFEGELSTLRIMGWLRIPCVLTNDFASGDEARTIEVRAWMYKTWEQDVNDRIGLVHPFNVEDFDARILWMGRWTHLLQSQTLPIGDGIANFVPAVWTPSGALAATPAFGQQVQSFNDSTHVRRFSIRQAVKIKGNERIALAFAAGPFVNTGATITIPVQGFARGLFRH